MLARLLVLLLAVGCGGSAAAPVAEPTAPPVTTAPTAVPTTPAPTTDAPTSAAPRHALPRATTTATRRSRATGAVAHRFPITGCTVSYGHSHHDYPATDVFAARGCRIVSPVTGRVDEVSSVDRWQSSTNRGADRGGLSFSIVGDDGVRYYGSHLQTLKVRAGQRVVAGQAIGTVGNSGDARGIATHLHFGLSWPTRHGIWWVRRGEVYPWPYLDSWRSGGNANPAAAVAREHRRQGDVPPCRVDC